MSAVTDSSSKIEVSDEKARGDKSSQYLFIIQ